LKSILKTDHKIRIFAASITPNGVEAAAEVADGFFPVWMDPEQYHVFEASINKGFARAGNNKSLQHFDIAPFVSVVLGNDLEQCRQSIREKMALYIGGMGARHRNFYKDYAGRLGYEDAAVKIQELYLSGKREAAAAAVPAELIDASALVGPAERIKERLQVWKAAGELGHVSSMLIASQQAEALELIAENML